MEEPILGRTHTDLFKTRNRITNVGGPGGLSFTYFSANGFSYAQIGVFVVSIVVWTAPLLKAGVPLVAWGGMSMFLLFGPPFTLAWASDRTLPNGKSLREWLTTRLRHRIIEKPLYVAGRPATNLSTTIVCRVWTPPKEGLRD